MSRIVSGVAGGISLVSVPGTGTRPTTDRTKEALFSWLESRGWLEETSVLDLYAGSGALGCEAASRGAGEVLSVEKHGKAASVCKRNAEIVNRKVGRTVVRVQNASVDTALQQLKPSLWDLILADPPYDLDGEPLQRSLEFMESVLDERGLLVVERSTRSDEPQWPHSLEVIEQRDYGETRLYFLRHENEERPDGVGGD